MRNTKESTMVKQNRSTTKRATKPRTASKKSEPKKTKPPSMLLSYRFRTMQDDPYILQLTREQLGETHLRAFGEPFPEDQFMRYVQSGAPTYIIENRGSKVGYYSYLVGPDMKMHISALVIDPKFQSGGLGKAVMKQLEDEAILRGVKIMEVFIQENNPTSVAFTKGLGFVETNRFPPNTICFQKQIAQQNVLSR